MAESTLDMTVAICTYNRSERLPKLVHLIREQKCTIPFDILFINNNSRDGTQEVLEQLQEEPGPPLSFVTETRQGIPYARNRALTECLNKTFMLFMDDDELPRPGLIAAAVDALGREHADCVGGRVEIVFPGGRRPSWLGDELLGFLAETNYSNKPFWICDYTTPVWTANVAYRMAIFREYPDMRFDIRYNREGDGIGGGEDAVLFRDMLSRKLRIRYRPDMVVEHHVESWRLRRSYFLQLHFEAGRKLGQYQLTDEYPRSLMGIPPFMIGQAMSQTFQTVALWLTRKGQVLRQAMNACHAYGTLFGRFLRWRQQRN